MKTLSRIIVPLCMVFGVLAQTIDCMPPHPDRLVEAPPQQVVENPFEAALMDYLSQSPRMLSLPARVNVLVLLVDFSDVKADTLAHSRKHFEEMLFSSNNPKSMRSYFLWNSYGKLDVTGQVKGWFRLPQPLLYYSDNRRGMGSYPRNARKMIEDAISVADAFIDFSRFDNDGPDGIPSSGDDDGVVDFLMVVHAGSGYEWTLNNADIHSHAGLVWVKVDGVEVTSYATEPEDGKVGTFAHEFGHLLGLPDLYDVTYNSYGLGIWSLMAYGAWGGGDASSPVGLDPWSKAKVGFLDPAIVTSNRADYVLPAVCDSPVVLRLWSGGEVGSEYFLIENRLARGWDSYLSRFGEGLLIYHVNERFSDNSGVAGHLVDLIQADGRNDLGKKRNFGFGSDGGDPYPGSTGNRNFSWWTVPANLDYAGNPTQVSVRNISDLADFMTFDLEVISPVVILKDYMIDDSGGDGDGRPEPGERISLGIRLINHGIACSNLRLNLSTDDQGFQIQTPNSFISHVAAKSLTGYVNFVVDIAQDVSEPYEAQFNLSIVGDHQFGVYHNSESFMLTIPLRLVANWPQKVNGTIVGSPIVADIDGDGFGEIVVGCIKEISVGVLKGLVYAWKFDGSIVNGFPVELPGSINFKPAACDLDADGAQEIIIATVSGSVHVLRGDGSLYPGWPQIMPSKVRVSPVVADVDDDGFVEIICCGMGGEIYVWNENGRIEKGWPLKLNSEILMTPGIGDIDSDHVADIVVGEYGGKLYCINGFGEILKGWPVDVGKGCGEGGASLADFDGDGNLEIAISSLFSNTVYVVGSDGKVKPGWPKITSNCSQLSSPVAADINRDGLPEVAVTTSCGTVVAWNGKGKECKTIAASAPQRIQSCEPVFADLDGNGTMEVIFGTSAGALSKLYAFSDVGEVSGFPIPLGGDLFATPLIADLDQDGHYEIVAATNPGYVYIWSYSGPKACGRAEYSQERGDIWNTGQYRFEPKQNVAMPDLGVYSNEIKLEPDKPRQGQVARIKAKIRNIGHASAKEILVRFFCDDQVDSCMIGEIILDQIEPKTEIEASQDWLVAFGQATHQIIVVVDPEDRIVENSDLNNAAKRRFYLSLADLEVAYHKIEPFPVVIGDSMSVRFSVTNKGEDMAYGFDIVVRDGLGFGQDKTTAFHVDSLGVGQSLEFCYRTVATQFEDDFRKIWVFCDPDSNVVEYYRSNNQAEIRVPSGVQGEIIEFGLDLGLSAIGASRYFAVLESPSCNCIFATPLASGQITLFEHFGSGFDVCRNMAVFGSNGDILGYDFSAKNLFVVSSDEAFEDQPCIWADRIGWVAQSDGQVRLMLKPKDQDAIVIREITDGMIEHPDISSDFLVWRENRDDECKIMAFDLTTGSTIEVGRASCIGSGPKVWGSVVVWASQGSGDLDIEGCDLSTMSRYSICSHKGKQLEPSIFGDIVVWQDDRNGNWDIYGYSLLEGYEFPITRQISNQTQPSICESTVVWLDNRTGKRLARGLKLGAKRSVANVKGFETLSQDGRIVVRTDIEQLDDNVAFRLYRYKDNRPLPADRARFIRHQFTLPKSQSYGFADTLVVPMRSYYYTLGVVDAYGEETLYGPIEGRCYPRSSPELVIGLPQPNPFRVSTSITVGLPRKIIPSDQVSWPDPSPDAAHLEVVVYSVAGRVVRRIVSRSLLPGYHTFSWDGKSDEGACVSPGVYFLTVNVRGSTVSRKVIYLR